MKNILLLLALLFSLLIFGQDFDRQWKTVYQYELDGKIKSAQEEVQSIYKKAKRKKEDVQIIKCFFYLSKFEQVFDEKAQTTIIDNLKKEIKDAKPTSRAILSNIYATILENYFRNSSYIIQKRTNLEDQRSTDFFTWTGTDFSKEIDYAYSKSIVDEKILRETFIDTYKDIFEISYVTDSKNFSLYDFLFEKYIAYKKTKIETWNYRNLSDKGQFENLFQDSKMFVDLKFENVSDKILKELLELLQKNEQFYLRNNSEKADWAYYRRLQYLHSINSERVTYYKNLHILEKRTLSMALRQELRVERAKFYNENASKQSEINFHQKALELVDTVFTSKVNQNALAKAETLKNNILRKTLSISSEKTIYPNKNTRALITFKNVDSIKISYYVFPTKNNDWFNQYYYRYDEKENRINKDSLILNFKNKSIPVKCYTRQLPKRTGNFEYSTEILLEKMDIGNYLIFVEVENDSTGTMAFTYDHLNVTNLTVFEDADEKNNLVYVLDRKTGKPIADVTIKSEDEAVKTNASGKAYLKKLKQIRDQKYDNQITISKANDTIIQQYNRLFLQDDSDDKDQYEHFESKAMVYFDRAIYRPGQKMYYKGILIQKKNHVKSVVPFAGVKVEIYDATETKLKELEIQTNEFGSFSGEFDIPKNTLTGQFFIKVDEPKNLEKDNKYYNEKKDGHAFWDNVDFNEDHFPFQVEEYKRPTFEVKLDEIKENYTIGDSIRIKGNAKAFAGNNLTNAKVSYTISKTVNGTADAYYYKHLRDYIINEIQTDENGNFTIDFLAVEEGRENKTIENFSFHIQANITDINGETRTVNKELQVGQKTMALNVNIAPNLFVEEEKTLTVDATTLNQFPIDAKGQLEIYEITQKSFLKSRLFPVPEIQTISRDEFNRLFPYESYDNLEMEENKVLVKKISFDTKVNKKVALDFLKKTGNYEIIITSTDTKNNVIEEKKNFSLMSKKNAKSDAELFSYVDASKPNSNFFEIEIQSIISDLYITCRFYGDQKNIQNEEILQLQNGKATFKFTKKPLLNNDVNFHFSTIWENKSAVKIYTIEKELIEPKLDIQILSMRNKIEPNSNENWSFKILNKKIEAEVLASMYDSSLDDFLTKDWQDVYFYEKYNYLDYPEIDIQNIAEKQILNFRSNSSIYHLAYHSEPALNWFGFDFNNPKNTYIRKKYLDKIQSKASTPKNAKIISGTVSEQGLPLPGVSVHIAGTTRGTQTDFDGYYEIEAAENEQLVFSYVGFSSKIIRIHDRTYNVIMEEDSQHLQAVEVVSTGYLMTRTVAHSTSAITISSKTLENRPNESFLETLQGTTPGLTILSSSGTPGSVKNDIFIRGLSSTNPATQVLIIIDGVPISNEDFKNLSNNDIETVMVLRDKAATAIYGSKGANGVMVITTKNALKEIAKVKTRTNFNETAFFYPHLKTDTNGQFSFNFTTPESLTRWKLRLYAHNKKAETGFLQSEIITQKDIMLQTNMPRFVREKDTITISAKVVNMTNEPKTGLAMLMLYDATNAKPIDSITLNLQNTRNFICKPRESVAVNWTISIPEGLQGLQYKIVAKSGSFSDGEESILPVLANKILITESIPIWLKGKTKKEYVFENLKNNSSTTLENHQFTLEYTSNPVWFALQSLPYLMEYEHECAEQTFSRYYANFIATQLIESNPKVASLFESWKNNPASNSKLNLNEELKSIVLNETPWLLDAETDELKNKRLALLMDLDTMTESMSKTFKKISEKQMPSGGFSWFDGGQENTYITQHIVAGLGHLGKMFPANVAQFETITKKAISYLDEIYIKSSTLKKEQINYYTYSNLHYLYARSFYAEKLPVSKKIDSIISAQKVESKANWLQYSLYKKALLALTMHRFGDKEFAQKIINNLKETAARNEDNGMYWIENKNGYYWYQSSIETQALLIEAFTEIEKDKTFADEMKVWLLKNKQTNHWPTTKSTTEAIYALLLQGSDWTSIQDNTKFKIGDEKVFTKKLSSKDKEAAMGYIKMNWKADEIDANMGQISVNNKSAVPGYGGVYWQYFENLENIKTDSIATLSITKNLFKKEKTTAGEKLVELTDKNITTGDLITIRLIIKTENDLEFVHLKDLRASCFEPVNIISQYQWKEQLNYYLSTKDVATHFFFEEIKKGTYVLEYDVRVNNTGHFNDGISTLQSMYAPEFSQHSKSRRVKVN